jgi:hypothetical protein
MTRGQIAQLQELRVCHNLPRRTMEWLVVCGWDTERRLSKSEKAHVRYLTHQYRHQIAAMRKNRQA